MSSLVVYIVIFIFWFTLAIAFLALDLSRGEPAFFLVILGRKMSAAWPCFIFAGYGLVRLFMNWAYQRRKVSEGMFEQTLRNRRRLPERKRPEEPPDPNFQFTDAPKDEPR